eukprot:gene50409-67511_t
MKAFKVKSTSMSHIDEWNEHKDMADKGAGGVRGGGGTPGTGTSAHGLRPTHAQKAAE